MQNLDGAIQQVTRSHAGNHSGLHDPAPPQAAPLMDQRVEVYGTSRHDLNGKHGVATDFHYYHDDRSRNRYSVLLDSGASYKFRPTAVRAEGLAAMASLLDQRVVFGGTRGVAVDYFEMDSEWGYCVELPDGTRRVIRAVDLRAERVEATAGARPKAKDGKKGRRGK